MIVLNLDEQEATVLQQLLDMACKAGGLQVAQAVVHLATKIAQAQQASKVPSPPVIEAKPDAVS